MTRDLCVPRSPRRSWLVSRCALLVALAGCSSGEGTPATGTGGTAGGDGSACPGQQTSCTGVCVDLSTSSANCGACGRTCPDGQTCSANACVGRSAGTGGGGTGGAADGGTGGTRDGGTGGATGGNGSGGCNVEPVNPNATAQARNLLCYLYEIYGNHVLSGQQEESWNWDNPGGDIIASYNRNYGVYPAVLGGDYLYPNGTSDRAIAYWKAGGIPLIRYHMGAPPGEDTFENSKGNADISAVLSSGTSANSSFNSKLDYIVKELQKLQDAKVALLFAPFHEYQPGGWFWWSKGTAEQFVQLWKYLFNYVTEKGLNNIVWLAPSSGTVDASWYPGKDFADIAGPDTYATDPPFSALYSSAKRVIGGTVPIPLHETGTIPDPSTMFPSAAPWVLWNAWTGTGYPTNSQASIRAAYESPFTITRDEVPSLD